MKKPLILYTIIFFLLISVLSLGTGSNPPTQNWNISLGTEIWSSPATANINDDNVIDIVVAPLDGKITAINGTNGGIIWSFLSNESDMWSSPTLADLQNDGKAEIIIGAGNKLYLLNGTNGNAIWNYTAGDIIASSPAVYDITADGVKDIFVGSCDKNLYAINGTGGNRIWNYTTGGCIWTASPIIADMAQGQGMEVAIGSYDARIYVLRATTGALRWSVSVFNSSAYMNGSIEGSAAAGDVNGDGSGDVVFGTFSGVLYALSNNGGFLWNFTTGSWILSSPAIVDINNDTKNEVVFGTHSPNGRVYVLNGTSGQQLWNASVGGHEDSSPTIADVNNDDLLDVVVGSSDGNVYAFNGTNGQVLWKYNVGSYIFGSPAINDVTGDGVNDIIVTTTGGKVINLDPDSIQESPITSDPSETPMFGGNIQRTRTTDTEGAINIYSDYERKGNDIFVSTFWKDGLSNLLFGEISENSTGDWVKTKTALFGVENWINHSIDKVSGKTFIINTTSWDIYGNNNTISKIIIKGKVK